jgi:hypothetical protein
MVEPDPLGGQRGDLDPAAQQRGWRPRQVQIRNLEPEALSVRESEPGEPQVERHQAAQAVDLDRSPGAGQGTLERSLEHALAKPGLRERESGADQEQDKTEPGPERKADASDHRALRFWRAGDHLTARGCFPPPPI